MPRYGRGRGFWGPGFEMRFGFGSCRRFPWLPRWWWTGIYGPITPYASGPYGYRTGYGTPYGSYVL